VLSLRKTVRSIFEVSAVNLRLIVREVGIKRPARNNAEADPSPFFRRHWANGLDIAVRFAVFKRDDKGRQYFIEAGFVHHAANLGRSLFVYLYVSHPSLRNRRSISESIAAKSPSSHCRW
jgi:hypothetical protein